MRGTTLRGPENTSRRLHTLALGGLAGIAALVGVVAPADAAYPGVNGPIVHDRKVDQFAPNSDPWTVLAGNPASARKLAKIKEASYDFVYSPNGKKIAFQAEVPSQEIVVMRSNGTKPKVITKKISKCIGKSRPTWSPDGRKIAFSCMNSRGFNQHDIWSANADGSNVKQITTTHNAYDPAWSPLGDKIAYTSFGGVIYVVPAGGGESTILSEDAPGGVFGGNWQRVDWAPDGLSLVSDSSGDGIYTINAATGATSGNLAISGAEPAFSPDGTKIVYVGFGQPAPSKELHLWMMDTNGANKMPVTDSGYSRFPNWGVAP